MEQLDLFDEVVAGTESKPAPKKEPNLTSVPDEVFHGVEFQYEYKYWYQKGSMA